METDGKRHIYSVNINDDKKAQLDTYGEIIRAEDGMLFLVRTDGKKYKIPEEKLYTCLDVTTKYMFGTDPARLRLAWNKAVKRHIRQVLAPYDDYLLEEEPEQPAATEQQPITSDKQEVARADITAPAENNTKEPFLRAIELEWSQVDMLLCLWIAKTFPEDSRVVAHANVDKDFATSWYIRLENVSAKDLPHLEATLARLGIAHGQVEPDGPEQVILDNEIANKVMGLDILPFQSTPFPYGVNRAFPSAGDIIFLSDYC